MRWAKEEWEHMHSVVIGNCLKHCFSMHGAEDLESMFTQIKYSIRKQLQQDSKEHDVNYTRVGNEYLLNPQD